MASLILYGSDIQDATLTTACDMSTTTGGVEVGKTTTFTGGAKCGEVTSKGGSVATVAAVPATPTGKGWVYKPGAGTFATANWSAIANLACASLATAPKWEMRFFQYSGGTYTSIGTITITITSSAKTKYTFTATSMGTVTLAAGDYVYVDLWYVATSSANACNPTVYESNSSSMGVANDMQITTSAFTPTSNSRTVPLTTALIATPSRTIPLTTALSPIFRTVPLTTSLIATNTRTVPLTTALAFQRIIPLTTSLTSTPSRTIPLTTSLSPIQRTIPLTTSLTGIIDVSASRALINQRLNFMTPSIIRTAAPNLNMWCPSGVVGTYDFTNIYMLDWYNVFNNAQAQGYAVIVAVNSTAPFTLLSSNWCTAFADLLNYLINSLGYTCIQYVSGLSEPDSNGAAYADYKNTIEPQLVTALNTYGLLAVVDLIGPDTTSANDSWLTSASTDLASLDGFARHAFPPGVADISNDSIETSVGTLVTGIETNSSNKPVFQTEMGDGYLGPGQQVATFQYGVEMADFAVQLMRAGIAAPIAYILDDDMHGTEWGFWQITQDTGFPRPWFFVWSLLCQILVPGAAMYAPAQPNTNDFRMVAALLPTGAWAFVLVNRRGAAQNVRLSIPFAPVATTTFNTYIYSSVAPLLVDGNGFPLIAGKVNAVLPKGFTVSMAANSVLILAQPTPVTTTVFNVKRGPLQKRR